jgi:hypothetical protein
MTLVDDVVCDIKARSRIAALQEAAGITQN